VICDARNHHQELVLVVVGEAECGKSSLIKALTSGGGSEEVGFGGVTGATSFTSWVADSDVSFEIFDVAGSAVFSVTHQLVLMRRAVYMFVWKIRKGINGQLAEWQERELRESVTEWVDSLQHKVPGASLLIVATHTDLACNEEDLENQVPITTSFLFTPLNFESSTLGGWGAGNRPPDRETSHSRS